MGLDNKLVIKYKGRDYDVSKFRKFHPGGANTLGWFKDSDVTKQLMETEHSEAAYSLLEHMSAEAELPDVDEEQIDWSQSLVKQIGGLGSRYHSWVERPVDRRARMFDWDWLEMLTVVQWYVIPMVWLPICMFFIHISHLRLVATSSQHLRDNERLYLSCTVLLGFLLWPLVEYVFHRWVFHFKPPDASPSLIVLHFCLHGIHHKVPFDERRLLFPPVPLAMLSSLMYFTYFLIFPAWAATAVFAGTTSGYILYDLTHYYLHYGSPREGSYFYFMKRYHNQHHFVHHNQGFGITTHLWDKALDTSISLRKIKYNLKW